MKKYDGPVSLGIVVSVILALFCVVWLFENEGDAAITYPTAVHTQYPSQGTPTKAVDTLRAAAALTTSYVTATDDAAMRGYDVVRLFFDITKGSLTSFQYRVWSSHDGVNWFQEANESVAATVITDSVHNYTMVLGANVKYFKDIPIYGVYLRVDVKGTGTVTGSSCAIYIMGVE